jgi:hypothetical protein
MPLEHIRPLAAASLRRIANREAEAVRWIIEPLHRAGLSRYRIAKELNERRIARPRGGRWDHKAVRETLRRLGLFTESREVADQAAYEVAREAAA